MIKLTNLVKHFEIEEEKIRAVDGVNLIINQGEIVAVMGASGCGKSTMLNCIGGLLAVTSGEISVCGKIISTLSEKELAQFRRNNIGFVFQSYNLMQDLTVFENIAMPLILGKEKVDKNEITEMAKKLGIEDKLNKFPNQISGGQQQRAAIARAVIRQNKVIIADEPTGNLDSTNSQNVMDLLIDIAKSTNTTLLIATHDKQVAAKCEKIITMQDGKVFLHFDNGQHFLMTVQEEK